jgi:hypothetical protein
MSARVRASRSCEVTFQDRLGSLSHSTYNLAANIKDEDGTTLPASWQVGLVGGGADLSPDPEF